MRISRLNTKKTKKDNHQQVAKVKLERTHNHKVYQHIIKLIHKQSELKIHKVGGSG